MREEEHHRSTIARRQPQRSLSGPRPLRGGLIPARTISAPVAQPNLYRFVVRPLYQHHVRPRDGIEQRGNFHLLAGHGVILRVEKTEAVQHSFNLSWPI